MVCGLAVIGWIVRHQLANLALCGLVPK